MVRSGLIFAHSIQDYLGQQFCLKISRLFRVYGFLPEQRETLGIYKFTTKVLFFQIWHL